MGLPAACLFDLDGLLLDTEPLHSQAWLEATAGFGLTLAADQLLALRGRRRLDCAEQVRSWIVQADLAPPSPEALLAARQPISERLMRQVPAIPGAQRLVKRCLAQAIPAALVSSSSAAAVAHKSAPHGWISLLKTRVLGDDPDLAAGKPAPDPYLLAAQRLGVDPSSCWAFEDSLAGARSAHAAGCVVHVLLPADQHLAIGLQADLPDGCTLLQSLDAVKLSKAAGNGSQVG